MALSPPHVRPKRLFKRPIATIERNHRSEWLWCTPLNQEDAVNNLSTFGTITSAGDPLIGQLALKLFPLVFA
jgi:hypothetical protein